jgi:hypothetical protein
MTENYIITVYNPLTNKMEYRLTRAIENPTIYPKYKIETVKKL